MIVVRDAVLTDVRLQSPARRIVSLVPSVTETLFALGIGSRLVGRTSFCVSPADAVAAIPKVGGTKDPDVDAIVALAPDLVLANREENREEDVQILRRSVPVHVSYPRDLEGLFSYLADLGTLLGIPDRTAALVAGIERARHSFRKPSPLRRVAYLIWRRPWMAAAPDTFIDGMLSDCGFANVVPGGGGRYPEITLESLRGRVDAVLLSSEPFPFAEAHKDEVARATELAAPRVQLVSGEAFSWFGSRSAQAFEEAARVHRLIAVE